jgi:hypothetical protein
LWDVDARFYDMKFTIEEREDNKSVGRWMLDVDAAFDAAVLGVVGVVRWG